MIDSLLEILVSLLPAVFFLGALRFLDSFELVSFRRTLLTIGAGCGAGIVAFGVNSLLMTVTAVDIERYSHFVAPVIEEALKATFVLTLILRKRVGFMVDAAIYGFAVGAGFALTENIFYLVSLSTGDVMLWLVRGFGTAMMHGATTAVFGILAKNLSERFPAAPLPAMLPGLVAAIIIHGVFNQFYIPATFSTIVILVVFPLLMLLVFEESEKATRHWLGVGFDSDREILEMLTTGNLSDTKIGMYLQSLQERFRGEVIADMLCLLRLHLELSIGAKGLLLMREAGFRVNADPEVKEKFAELRYLERSIGKTGKLTIDPFLHMSTRHLWQLYVLGGG